MRSSRWVTEDHQHGVTKLQPHTLSLSALVYDREYLCPRRLNGLTQPIQGFVDRVRTPSMDHAINRCRFG